MTAFRLLVCATGLCLIAFQPAIGQTPALTLDKSAGGSTYDDVGDTISYRYFVTNSGDGTLAEPLTIIDDKITATCALSGDGDLDEDETIICTSDDYVITQDDVNNGSVTNLATAYAGGTTSNQDSVTVYKYEEEPPGPSCSVHCDCPQGSFCYDGTCLSDPKMPVYCCDKSDSCPPGRWCFNSNESKGTCSGYLDYVCESTCDCGPAHACKEVPGMDGKRCVKDTNDPWDPGGANPFGVTVIQGEDATYCCEDPLCDAGWNAYGGGQFLCSVRETRETRSYCGGGACASLCDCDAGESCVDTNAYDFHTVCTADADCPPGNSCDTSSNSCRFPTGKVCDWEFKSGPDGLSASCVSNAVAEAVYGIDTFWPGPCCDKGCFSGQRCVVGWQQGGGYLLEQIVGVCGGSCGNGSCDPGESADTCEVDCYRPPPYPDCGEMSCGYTGHYAMCGDGTCDPDGYTPENCLTCPKDCGEPTHFDGDKIANCIDNCPGDNNADQADFDGDGIGDACDPDIDGDGVPNDMDSCAMTPFGDLVDPENGCSIEQLCPCDDPRGTVMPWKNHGKYVSCVAHAANDFRDAGLISDSEHGDIVSAAGQSSCGHRN